MGYKSIQTKEEDRHRIIKHFESMTKEQLIRYIKDNLYFDEDFCRDEWSIYVDTYEEGIILVGMEK